MYMCTLTLEAWNVGANCCGGRDPVSEWSGDTTGSLEWSGDEDREDSGGAENRMEASVGETCEVGRVGSDKKEVEGGPALVVAVSSGVKGMAVVGMGGCLGGDVWECVAAAPLAGRMATPREAAVEGPAPPALLQRLLSLGTMTGPWEE